MIFRLKTGPLKLCPEQDRTRNDALQGPFARLFSQGQGQGSGPALHDKLAKMQRQTTWCGENKFKFSALCTRSKSSSNAVPPLSVEGMASEMLGSSFCVFCLLKHTVPTKYLQILSNLSPLPTDKEANHLVRVCAPKASCFQRPAFGKALFGICRPQAPSQAFLLRTPQAWTPRFGRLKRYIYIYIVEINNWQLRVVVVLW